MGSEMCIRDSDEKDPTKAEKQVVKMSEKLLANTVIEDYQIDIQENK